jgi:MYND finger
MRIVASFLLMPVCVQCQGPKATRVCGRCLTATYCSVVCQRTHWDAGHRLACTVSYPLFQAPRAYKSLCAHGRGSLVWLGSANKEPRAFCSAECATEWLGYPAVVVNGTTARAFLLARVDKDPDSPLRRLFQHHFHLEHDASAPMARELAQLSLEHACGPLDNKPLLKEKEPVGKRGGDGDLAEPADTLHETMASPAVLQAEQSEHSQNALRQRTSLIHQLIHLPPEMLGPILGSIPPRDLRTLWRVSKQIRDDFKAHPEILDEWVRATEGSREWVSVLRYAAEASATTDLLELLLACKRLELDTVSLMVAIEAAAKVGRLDAVKLLAPVRARLVTSVCRVNAAYSGNIDLVKFVLSASTDTSSDGSIGNYAIRGGHADMVRYLLAHPRATEFFSSPWVAFFSTYEHPDRSPEIPALLLAAKHLEPGLLRDHHVMLGYEDAERLMDSRPYGPPVANYWPEHPEDPDKSFDDALRFAVFNRFVPQTMLLLADPRTHTELIDGELFEMVASLQHVDVLEVMFASSRVDRTKANELMMAIRADDDVRFARIVRDRGIDLNVQDAWVQGAVSTRATKILNWLLHEPALDKAKIVHAMLSGAAARGDVDLFIETAGQHLDPPRSRTYFDFLELAVKAKSKKLAMFIVSTLLPPESNQNIKDLRRQLSTDEEKAGLGVVLDLAR